MILKVENLKIFKSWDFCFQFSLGQIPHQIITILYHCFLNYLFSFCGSEEKMYFIYFDKTQKKDDFFLKATYFLQTEKGKKEK